MADLEIREQIARYVAGDVDAGALEDWLEDVEWESAQPAESVLPTALRLLAEYEHGDWTEEELRSQLDVLVETYRLEQPPRSVSTGSDSHVILEDRQSASVERLHVAESV